MLKGYLNCNDIGKMLLGYIHFELSKREMAKVARHLRNCPKCMEKYTEIQKRKKILKEKFIKIENQTRRQIEISSYIDKEASEDLIFIIEGMLLSDVEYKKELIETEETRRLLQESKKALKKEIVPKQAMKIIAKIKNKKKIQTRISKKLIQLFQPLLRAFAKSV